MGFEEEDDDLGHDQPHDLPQHACVYERGREREIEFGAIRLLGWGGM
jgi:hypothetical protein